MRLRIFKKFIKIIFIGVLCGLLGYCVGRTTANPSTKAIKLEFAPALPDANFYMAKCVQPMKADFVILEHAVKTIELDALGDTGFLDIGAQIFLSNHDQCKPKPKEILKRISLAFDKRGDMVKGRLVKYQLDLASQLVDPSAKIVEIIATTAFNEQAQQDEDFFNNDIRPYARYVLASLGGAGVKYVQQAFDQITNKDAMGTGAAQIAVSANHPLALKRVHELMKELLSKATNGKPIPRYTRDRLYELAHAISFAGDKGKQFSSPIRTLMHMQVETFIPLYGNWEHPPKRMCEVLKRIEGENALAEFSYCSDEKVGLEW